MTDLPHALNVSILAKNIGQQMRLDERAIALLSTAAMFHDIGKMGLPPALLDKPTALTPDEYQIIQWHTTLGYNILSNMPDDIHGLLYQEKKTNNCVFVGYAPDGVARYAARKGTYTKNGEVFRGEVAGSKKMFSFSYTPNEDSFILRIQESPIEIMSHMSIDKMDGADWRNKHYISLGGLTYEPVYAYLRERPEIKVMEVCVNNDEAGHNMIQKYQERFGDQVEVVANMPDIIVTDKDGNPKGGDHNDLLLKKNCNQPAASRTITAYDFLQSERSV